jgi:hypothetical protein
MTTGSGDAAMLKGATLVPPTGPGTPSAALPGHTRRARQLGNKGFYSTLGALLDTF